MDNDVSSSIEEDEEEVDAIVEKRVFLSCGSCTAPITARVRLPACACLHTKEPSSCPYSPRSAPPLIVNSPRSELPVLMAATGGFPAPPSKETVPEFKVLRLLKKYTDVIERRRILDSPAHEPYVRRATLLAAIGDYDRSRRDAAAAIAIAPTSAVAAFRLGVAEYRLGNFDRALAAFANGLQHAPASKHLNTARDAAIAALRSRPMRHHPLFASRRRRQRAKSPTSAKLWS
ncbi:hypothetical protein CTAYLR_008346 [Chrysophaeum taylorii]|uniref:Tetratricopeptide repeat protein n=1 Tax=Chrysophaeum taylorii TaxID=2483200 RepID=A0AAD7XNQ4_9STRA|nr:hypothetical protein CTAYLR_008346 [Chrysophaeum taylorii]